MKRIIIFLMLCSVCFSKNLSFTFNGGEISPLFKYRIDQEKYYSSCLTLENMIPLPLGAAIRRPGTKYVATTKGSGRVRLFSFEYDTTDTYIIEAGNLYMRFFRNGGQILDDNDNPYEITTVYTTAQLRDIHAVQINDVMKMVSPDVHPQTLTRFGHTNWTIADTAFTQGPFNKENSDTTTITPSAATGTITLTASADLFTEDHIGSLWKLIHIKEAESIEGSFTSDANSSELAIEVNREWEFVTHGVWTGKVLLEKTYDSGTNWLTEYTIDSKDDDNRQEVGIEEEKDASYRVRMTNYSSGTCTYSLLAYAHPIDGDATITKVHSGTVATATVNNTFGGTNATVRWAEGKFNPENGYPRAVGLFQQRAVYGGTLDDPAGLWLSASAGDYDNMYLPTAAPDDDDAIVYTVATAKQNPIQWIYDADNIIMGTNGGVIQVGVLDSSAALTGTNINSRSQAGIGSAHIQPVTIENANIFIERNGVKVRRLTYSFESDEYNALDMTILAEHFFDSEIVEMAVQNRPEPILWCVLADGTLLGMSYQQEHDVIAWHTHPIDGNVESVAVIPGSDEDEVWLAVERTILDTSQRYIEQMQPQNWGGDNNDIWFVDSGLAYDGTATATLTGLEHLEGETIQVFGDAGFFQEVVVNDGEVTINQTISKGVAGLGYTSLLETMPAEIQGREGPTVGHTKRIIGGGIGFYNSLQIEYGYTDGDMYPVKMYESSGSLSSKAPDLVNRFINVPFHGRNNVEAAMLLRQAKPYPMGITAITMDLTYGN